MAGHSAVKRGQLHRYNANLVAFEHDMSASPQNILLWVGGLGDSLLSVSYPSVLAQFLPNGWALAEASLSSSLHGWGTGSVMRDAKELGKCVSYFREHYKGSKIVVMGHSTGCQDAMEYVSGSGVRPPLDGVILQAPVSDREALGAGVPEDALKQAVKVAQEYVKNGQGDQLLPAIISNRLFGNTPVSAYRALSLLSPNKDGDDDYFSSDLPDTVFQKTFGKFTNIPLLILCSGNDEHVPPHVDVPGLVRKWSDIVEKSGGIVDRVHGGIIKGASHNLEDDHPDIVHDLCQRVYDFVVQLDSSV